MGYQARSNPKLHLGHWLQTFYLLMRRLTKHELPKASVTAQSAVRTSFFQVQASCYSTATNLLTTATRHFLLRNLTHSTAKNLIIADRSITPS